MARYIDADALLSRLPDDIPYKASVKRVLMQAPEADVVPKSEYDEVLSSWQKIHDSYDADCIEHYNYGRAEVAKEIFEEIERWIGDYNGCRAITYEKFAELKDKYTEGKDDQLP